MKKTLLAWTIGIGIVCILAIYFNPLIKSLGRSTAIDNVAPSVAGAKENLSREETQSLPTTIVSLTPISTATPTATPKFSDYKFDKSMVNAYGHIYFFGSASFSDDNEIKFLYEAEDTDHYIDNLIYKFGENIDEEYLKSNPPMVEYVLFIDGEYIATSDYIFEIDGSILMDAPKDMYVFALGLDGEVMDVVYLPNLMYYNRYAEQISDFSDQFPQVQNLFVHAGEAEELSELAGLKYLTTLEIQAENYEDTSRKFDLSFLSSLPKLSALYISYSYEVDINDIKKCDNLKYLSLSYLRGIDNIESLCELNTLESLSLSAAVVHNLDFADGLDRLKNLVVSSYYLSDISGVRYLSQLEFLTIYESTELRDISALSSLKNLVFLNLYNCEITSVEPIAKLDRLKCLFIYAGNVTDRDFSELSNLSDLRYLSIGGTDKSELAFIDELENLQILD